MLHFQKFCMQIHCVQNSGAFLLLVSITDNIYIHVHRLLNAKSLSLNFRKFVVFMPFMQDIYTAFSISLCAK